MSTGNKFSHSKPYSQSQSCPIPVGNSLCGETNSLEIMKEFNKLYEDRMQQVDSIAGGDCLQEKIKLQQEWIQNLTQQNEMLVKAVQDLEYEATERVKQLEDKLHKNAQCLCEVMKKYREFDFSVDLLSSPIQKITQLENDKKNLLEFINRIRDNQDWSIDGLFFYNVAPSDLLGPTNKICDKSVVEVCSTEGEEILKTKDRALQELTQKLNYINSFGDVECMVKELQCRREECESLKEAMADMRQALTEEVASKHDQIILLKREMQVIEETCAQAEKQIIFKDDIIKELRKDIKQLKQQIIIPEKVLNSFETNRNECQSPLSVNNVQDSLEHPYLIIKHTSKKLMGKNTVIYINKDGSVQKSEQNRASEALCRNFPKHSDVCVKCKNHLMNRSAFPICKSENELTNMKDMLRPVKERSKITNGSFKRGRTCIDKFKDKKFTLDYIPVRTHVNNLEISRP